MQFIRRRKFMLTVVLACGLAWHGVALALSQECVPQSGDEPTDTPAGAREGDAASDIITEADELHQIAALAVGSEVWIDGVLDEPEWASAAPAVDFVQKQPSEGQLASERTEVRVLHDTSSLYIGAIMYDREPEQINATVLRRDGNLDLDDSFVVTLDTYHDHRNGYFFQTNAHGARLDAQIIGEGGQRRGDNMGSGPTFQKSWDAVWYAAGRITEDGWVVEIEIPFYSLRFNREHVGVWGINFGRSIPRCGEQSFWAPVPRQYNATRFSRSGILRGLQQIGSPSTVQVKPYVRGGAMRLPLSEVEAGLAPRTSVDLTGDSGLDLKWTFAPNMALDLAVNPDFSHVEADDVQINLTRFPLLFPEKREFFLENAGLFQFGTVGGPRGSTPALGFHSRKIGISEGEQISLFGGGRVTGKAGPWSIGTLVMQSRAEPALGSTSYGVVRIRRELGNRSDVGVLFTNRQTSGDDYNREIGVDGRWVISPQVAVGGWWMSTDTPGLDGASWAGAMSFLYATPLWQVDGSVTEIGEAFNPELGFIARTGVRHYKAMALWSPYPEAEWVRNLGPHVALSYLTDRDGRLLTSQLDLDFDIYLRRGDKLSVEHIFHKEVLDEPFEIMSGVFIPPGAYDFNETVFELRTDVSRPANVSANYTLGDFYGGRRKKLLLGGGFRLGSRFSARLDWQRNDIELPGGSFVTDLLRTRLSYDVSTRLFLAALIQYDNVTDQVLTNVRLNFIHTPGADLFIVYDERRLTVLGREIDRALAIKFTHLLRF